ALWTSVTKKIRSASRSGLVSIGRARSPPANCVVSMHTPTFSMMSQTRSMLSCSLMSMHMSDETPLAEEAIGSQKRDRSFLPRLGEDGLLELRLAFHSRHIRMSEGSNRAIDRDVAPKGCSRHGRISSAFRLRANSGTPQNGRSPLIVTRRPER